MWIKLCYFLNLIKLTVWRRKTPRMVDNFFLHHGITPPYTVHATVEILEDLGMKHPPYSLDLAHCYLWFFLYLKDQVWCEHLNSLADVTQAVHASIRKLTLDDFKMTFENWICRMKKCILCNGKYFECRNIQVLILTLMYEAD